MFYRDIVDLECKGQLKDRVGYSQYESDTLSGSNQSGRSHILMISHIGKDCVFYIDICKESIKGGC